MTEASKIGDGKKLEEARKASLSFVIVTTTAIRE